MSILKLPLQLFSHYFGPLQWFAGQNANAPTVPYTTSQVGSFQYQTNGQWQRANWDGTAWIPSPGDYVTGEFRTALDNARADMLAKSAADQAVLEWALNRALQISVPINWQIKSIDPTVNTAYTAVLTWAPPQDPLVLDLNGGGISTVGIDPVNPILFDHNADGVRTGTGWLGAGEGILTLDINGNGTVDSGRELFGDNTILTRASDPRVGQMAANGFDALRDLDANADGKIDSADAVYSQLRIWQDVNQDAVSQATELQTLAALGIQTDPGKISPSGVSDPRSVGVSSGCGQPVAGVERTAHPKRKCRNIQQLVRGKFFPGLRVQFNA